MPGGPNISGRPRRLNIGSTGNVGKEVIGVERKPENGDDGNRLNRLNGPTPVMPNPKSSKGENPGNAPHEYENGKSCERWRNDCICTSLAAISARNASARLRQYASSCARMVRTCSTVRS